MDPKVDEFIELTAIDIKDKPVLVPRHQDLPPSFVSGWSMSHYVNSLVADRSRSQVDLGHIVSTLSMHTGIDHR